MSNTENSKWAQFDSADLDLLQKELDEKDENIDAVIKTVLAKYNLEFTSVHDEFFGDRLEGKARSINISINNFNAAKSGMIATTKYC
jgi:hypothetical protein